jgi:energy-coupling factor transporter ATP-binding protein EcfA2
VLLAFPSLGTESISLNENIAVFERVSYIYPRSETLALKDISLQIHKGEFLGLIGPTGAGKSTFCMTLNGIVPQFFGGRFFGHVYINGLDSLDVPISTLAQHTGMVFEDPETQITATSVENEIAFALENLKVPRDLIQARIPEALKAVRLEGMEKKHPYELSGGQKQRLAIAAALAVQPELLILDEPTSQLDSIGTTEVFRNILELNKELAITIVMASHAAEELAENADRIVLLSHGEIIENAAPSDIYNDVEYLYQYNLRSPQVAETFYLINKYGRDTPQIPVNLEQGLDILTHMTHQDILEHHCDGPSPPPPPQNHSVVCARDIPYT